MNIYFLEQSFFHKNFIESTNINFKYIPRVINQMLNFSLNCFSFIFYSIFLCMICNYFVFRYDNDYDYSNRIVDLIKYIDKKDHEK
jgi:hypothetical protein